MTKPSFSGCTHKANYILRLKDWFVTKNFAHEAQL